MAFLNLKHFEFLRQNWKIYFHPNAPKLSFKTLKSYFQAENSNFFGQKIEAWISVWEALEIQRPTNRSLIERWCERKIILNQFETCGHFFIEHHHNPRHFFRKQKEIVLPFKNRFLTGGRVAAIYRFGLLQRNSIFELLRFCSRTLIPPLILLYNVDFEKKKINETFALLKKAK